MPVRHFLPYILFLLVAAALPVAAQAPPPQTPTSHWWYPAGNPERTRDNVDPTAEQDTVTPVIKWRAPSLRNAPDIAVGAILNRTGDPKFQQQVVGILRDTLIILSGFGTVERRAVYNDSAYFSTPFQLTLTGLFNMGGGNVFPTGVPTAIGIGVERTQGSARDSLWAFLADSSGKAVKRIPIDTLPTALPLALRHAGIFPVAAFGKSAYITITQNDNALPATGTVANAFKRERFNSESPFYEVTQTQWSYPVGPRTYPQTPSIVYDAFTNRNYFALSTTTYIAGSRVIAHPPTGFPTAGTPTASDSMYAINLSDTLGAAVNVNTRPVPVLGGAANETSGECDAYFTTLFSFFSDAGAYFRAITENHDPQRPGIAKLTLASAFTPDTVTYGSFTDPDMQDLGWTVLTADVDGDVADRPSDLPGHQIYRANHGEELVAARRAPDGSDLETNYIYLLRRSYIDTATTHAPLSLHNFIKQKFSGRLLAAGDLYGDRTGDSHHRQELVIAHGNTVSILQLLEYTDPNLGDFRENFFRTLATFTLDSPVLTAAIADLEGDGANDLIVTTKLSTYAIGHPVPKPFGTIASDSARYCRGRQVKIAWNRKIGGGENGVRVTLLAGASTTPWAYAYHSASPDPLNTGTGADSITIDTHGLAPGSYRVLLQDTIVAAIADTSNTFTIDQPVIGNFALDTSAGVDFDRPFTLSARVACSAGLYVVRSFDGVTWDTLTTLPVTLSGDQATATDHILCPVDAHCGGRDSVRVFYFFTDINHFGTSETRTVTIPIRSQQLTLQEDNDGDTRTQTVAWSPGAFACSTVRVSLADSNGTVVHEFDPAPTSSLSYNIVIPDDISGKFTVHACCDDASCHYGVSGEIDIRPLPNGNYVAPNPFNVHAHGGELNSASIVYRLKKAGSVTITIYDAGRAVVWRMADGDQVGTGIHRTTWDGRNSRGDIVASGAYICTIESSSGEQIILPIIVNKY